MIATTLRLLSIDSSSPSPPWLQLKEQIKVAYALGQLKPGDVLPSIRSLASQLSIGEAMVRRAYGELISLGLLRAMQRKQYMVVDSLSSPAETKRLIDEATAQCDEMLRWAAERGVSPIGLSRFFRAVAVTAETSRPSYAYVTVTAAAARHFAAAISRAWEVRVAGWTLDELESRPKEEVGRMAALLVNYIRYEEVRGRVDPRYTRVYPIRLGLGSALVRRMRRLSAGSRILLVFSRSDIERFGGLVLDLHRTTVGAGWQFECAAFEDIEDLGALAEADAFRLIVVSVHLWDRVSERARRQSKVVVSQYDPDPASLEEVRLKAGVLA